MSGWPAPSKLNLFLNVTGRRADGYHTLQTLFQFVDFGDELNFRVRDDGEIVRKVDVAGIAVSEDLCVKAANVLKIYAQCPLGADISLRKNIPVGGGLGGGSSDAATTLIVLNHLWQTELPRDVLAELGLQLGADVPVFVHGRAAWAESVGEQLTPINPEETYYVILTPKVFVSTASVFANHKLTAVDHAITIRDFYSRHLGNELEPTVCALYPEVEDALNWLGRFGDARMTGTGASVFLAVVDRSTGDEISAQRPKGYHGFVARGVNDHPLLGL